MADLTGYSTISDFVTVQTRQDAVLVPNTQNMFVGDIYQIGVNVYNVSVGQKCLFTDAYFFSLESQSFAAVHKDNIVGTYTEVLPP